MCTNVLDQEVLNFAGQIDIVKEQLGKGLSLQDSSSKMMLNLAADLLDFSQLNNGMFRKSY